ncbi:MAG TPA: hypothetical protein VEK79_10045 [Thermoanaerobaculia bacterium]|nr:hypothetical protein [Thermoanaerobaculia bacterium]
MQQPDSVSVRILRAHGTPPDGMTVLHVDLAEFFRMVARVGRDAALLLLTIRALRQRSGGGIRMHDLAWITSVSPRRIRSWLDQLVAAGSLVYDQTNGTVEVELPEVAPPTWTDIHPPGLPLRSELPTHWFIHVLPRLGRRAFVAYLYLLRRDGMSAPATLEIAALAREAALVTPLHARWHLRQLRRFGLTRFDPVTESLLVLDPPPLTPASRRWLRRRRMGDTAQRWIWFALAALVAAAIGTLLLVLRTRPGA